MIVFTPPTRETQQEMLDRLQDVLRPPVVIMPGMTPEWVEDSLRWEECEGQQRAIVWTETN